MNEYTTTCKIRIINEYEFRCYEVKKEETKKASCRRESNPGHLWLEPPALCHWATTAWQPPTPQNPLLVLHRWYWLLQSTPGSHSVCAVRTLLGGDWRIQQRTHAEWFCVQRVDWKFPKTATLMFFCLSCPDDSEEALYTVCTCFWAACTPLGTKGKAAACVQMGAKGESNTFTSCEFHL